MNGPATDPIPFVAASAEEAVAQIRARLGSDAVVLRVRPLKAPGLARLWQKPMIEVVACRPEPPPPPETAPSVSEALPDSARNWTKSNSKSNSTTAAGAWRRCCKRPGCSRFTQNRLLTL
jgi:flagellar biosynthesis GTPase FlhF